MAARRKPKITVMDETLKKRLDDQDDKIEIILNQTLQAMELLKGSTLLDYPGLIQSNKRLAEQLGKIDSIVQHIERWRQVQIAKKGTFTFKTASLLTKGLAVLGGLNILIGTFYVLIQIYKSLNL